MNRKPQRVFDVVQIRDVNDLHIVIYDERTAYVRPKSSHITYCFHRWFHKKRNFYSDNWKPFVIYLRENKNIDFQEIRRRAIELDIVIQAGTIPDLTGKKCKILPAYKNSRRKDECNTKKGIKA